MFYLIDSSAKDYNGHNLEYLERIRPYFPQDTKLLVNIECRQVSDSHVPIFNFGTWDFGRFGKFAITQRINRASKASESHLLNENKCFRRVTKILFLSRFVFYLVSKSQQTRTYLNDLETYFSQNSSESNNFFVSTSNFREICALFLFKEKFVKSYPASIFQIALRRPISEMQERWMAINYLEAFLNLSILHRTRNEFSFLVDTMQLKSHYDKYLKGDVVYLGVPGYNGHYVDTPKSINVLIPGNFRTETREQSEDLDYLDSLHPEKPKSHLSPQNYKELLSKSRFIVLPYVPNRYRYRSSGIFAESLSLGVAPIVPTGTWMSQELAMLVGDTGHSSLGIFNARSFSVHCPRSDILRTFRIIASSTITLIKISYAGHFSYHTFSSTIRSDVFVLPGKGEINFHCEVLEGHGWLEFQTSNSKDPFLGVAYFPGFLAIVAVDCMRNLIPRQRITHPNRYDPENVARIITGVKS